MATKRGTFTGFIGYAFQKGATGTGAVIDLEDLGFTADQVKGADVAYISTETNGIRYRFDGGDPDATTGHLAATGSLTQILTASNCVNLRIIGITGAGVIQVTLARAGVGIAP